MEKIIFIEGMTCGHCTSSVKGALKSLDNVKDVEMNLEEGIAKVRGENLKDEDLKTTIEDIGFDVKDIK